MPRDTSTTDTLAKQVLAATRYITPRLWMGDVSSFAELLDQGVAYAPITSRSFIYGKQEVIRTIVAIARTWHENGLVQIRDERYDVRMLGDDLYMAMARYRIVNGNPNSSFQGHRQSFYVLSSMVWQRADNDFGCLLLLCHSSEHKLTGKRPGAHTTDSAASRSRSKSSTDTSAPTRFAIQTHDAAGTTHWIVPSSVVFVKAARQYSLVHCTDRIIRMRGSLSGVIEQLSNEGVSLVQVHRSYAVNPTYVELLEGNTVHLSTGDQVPVPARRTDEIRAMLTSAVVNSDATAQVDELN